jgi:hypothetical protein
MPIVIQELLSSDTISQAVEKINFNFDQLILNGGGPVGPAGPIGPTGPVGGRGLRGATWYKDNTVSPGVNPNTLIIPGLEEEDYYLQSNGQVWQYNGTVWVQTIINLTGPQGPSGLSFGFNYAGGFPGGGSINNQNIAYPVPMPGGAGSGANLATNQGVSALLIGAVASNAIPPSGIGAFTSAFQLPDAMTQSLDSSLLSALVHQKDSSSSAIRFMGGGDNPSDKYEQLLLGNLANITLGVDDSFNINVPKAATSPSSISDLIGFNLNTIRKGQQFYSGKHINFISGADLTPSGLSSEISDISFILNTSNPIIPAKFSVSTVFASANALFEVGGNITIPATTIKTGRILGEAGFIGLVASTEVLLRASASNAILVRPAGILITAGTGPINISTTNTQSINISSNDNATISAINTINLTSTIIENVGTLIVLRGGTNVHRLAVDNGSTTVGGTKLSGNVTWDVNLLGLPFVTSHRNISINKGSLTIGNSPIYIGHTTLGNGRSLMIDVFKGLTQAAPIEYNRIYTASTDILSTSGNAGWVGHTVENQSTAMDPLRVGYRLRGRDRISGGAIQTRFYASEDTTAVYNRMQYVKKSLFIDPLYAGITGSSAGTGFTIPVAFMDATYLDIIIGSGGFAPFDDFGVSANEFFVNIPAGSYQGQRLVVHIIAVNAYADSGRGTPRAWPSVNGKVKIACAMGAAGSSYQFIQVAELLIPLKVIGTGLGAEATIELLWVGEVYTGTDVEPSGLTEFNRSSGWILTNGVGITSATVGTYQAVMNNQTWA